MPFSKPVLAVAKALGMLPGPNKLFFFFKSTQHDGVKTLSKINKSMFFSKFFFQGSEFFVGWKKIPKIVGNFQTFF